MPSSFLCCCVVCPVSLPHISRSVPEIRMPHDVPLIIPSAKHGGSWGSELSHKITESEPGIPPHPSPRPISLLQLLCLLPRCFSADALTHCITYDTKNPDAGLPVALRKSRCFTLVPSDAVPQLSCIITSYRWFSNANSERYVQYRVRVQ